MSIFRLDQKIERTRNSSRRIKPYTVKPRLWKTDRSAAKVFHMRDLFHMRGSIFGVIFIINAVLMP